MPAAGYPELKSLLLFQYHKQHQGDRFSADLAGQKAMLSVWRTCDKNDAVKLLQEDTNRSRSHEFISQV